MDRRSFIKKAGVAAGAVATTTLATPAISQGVKELKMVTSWPKNFPGLGTAASRFGKRIETLSGGKYKIRLFAGGELVSPIKCLDAIQQGTADLYHSADYYYRGKNEGFGWYTTVPFGFTANEMDSWLIHGGGQQLWDELGSKFGVKSFPCGNTGSQMGGWFRKPIKSLEDFKGLKMRIPGLGGKVIDALGGSAQLLGGKDIMPALTSGTIDATEWVGPWNDLAFGFYKVLKHYHFPGFHEPGATLSLGISAKLWGGMSKTDQLLFETCAHAENNYDLAEFNANNSAALHTLLTKHGVKLHEFPDEVFKAMGEASKDVLSAAGNSSPIAKKIYESFLAFRKNAVGWSKLSDQAYMQKRALTKF
jgi:TRAP-type mannitol/chloroaromatic compound transport system substrate-binding protein